MSRLSSQGVDTHFCRGLHSYGCDGKLNLANTVKAPLSFFSFMTLKVFICACINKETLLCALKENLRNKKSNYRKSCYCRVFFKLPGRASGKTAMSLSATSHKRSISSVFRAHVMVPSHRQEVFVSATALWGAFRVDRILLC